MTTGYEYLASPYTHPDRKIELARYRAAEAATAWLLQQRIWVYSPIVHCHALAVQFHLPTDAEFWGEYNKVMLSKADGILILALDGWEDSRGVTAECEIASKLRMSMHFMKPDNGGYKVTR